MSDNIQQKAKDFAEKHNLDPIAVEMAMRGVLIRIKTAVEKGQSLTPDLVEKALIHWHLSQEQFYQDLLENKDGQLDTLSEKVFTELQAKENK